MNPQKKKYKNDLAIWKKNFVPKFLSKDPQSQKTFELTLVVCDNFIWFFIVGTSSNQVLLQLFWLDRLYGCWQSIKLIVRSIDLMKSGTRKRKYYVVYLVIGPWRPKNFVVSNHDSFTSLSSVPQIERKSDGNGNDYQITEKQFLSWLKINGQQFIQLDFFQNNPSSYDWWENVISPTWYFHLLTVSWGGSHKSRNKFN